MAEATEHQKRAEKLLEKLWNDGELGPKLRAAAKKEFDDIRLPEDAIAPILEAERAERAKLEKQVAEMAEREAKRETEAAEARTFESLRSKVDNAAREYSLTDEGRAKMLDRMKETGNLSDPDAAAAWVASKAPPPPSLGPTWAPQNLNLFGSAEKDEQYASLHRNPERYMDDQLSEFLRNPDKYVAETLGA